MQKLIDISIPIKEGMVIYPKNPEVVFETERGNTSTLTQVTLGTHTGTHIDAPSHASKNTLSIDQVDLNKFYGDVRVLDLSHIKTAVTISDLEKYNIQKGERILLKTYNSIRGFDQFFDDFVYLDGDAAEYLAEIGIYLCGIDYLSIKQRGSDDHRPHTVLLEKEIAIIEAIDLKSVEEGRYILSAFPLKLEGLDGSPCRAVLIKE